MTIQTLTQKELLHHLNCIRQLKPVRARGKDWVHVQISDHVYRASLALGLPCKLRMTPRQYYEQVGQVMKRLGTMTLEIESPGYSNMEAMDAMIRRLGRDVRV